MRPRLLLMSVVGLVALAIGALVLARPTPDDPPQPWYNRPPQTYPDVTNVALAPGEDFDQRFASLAYGVHTFLWWNSTYRTWDLENVRLMNFAYVKQKFAWRDVQPTPHTWTWQLADEVVAETAHRGRRVVARLDTPPDWAIQPATDPALPPFDMDALADYCGNVAARYAGQIEAYQIWNEPNLAREWGEQPPDPRAYVVLLARCAGAIRQADPNAIIISAGLSPTGTRTAEALPDEEFLWEMYAAGAAPHFDVLGLNAPGYALPPETSLAEATAQGYDRWARFRHVEDMRAIMVHNGDAHKQIAILEMGWTTDNRPDSIYAWFGVSQAEQADYLRRAYAFAAENWRPWVGLMVVIYISNDVWTPEDEQWWWSLDEPTAPPQFKIMRPAYYALANMPKISDNPDFAESARNEDGAMDIVPLPGRN